MIGTICTAAVAFSLLAYAIPHFIVAWFYKTKNLKKAYNAEWALVTGASSGAQMPDWSAAVALPAAPTESDAPPFFPCRHRQVDCSQAGWPGPECGAGGVG